MSLYFFYGHSADGATGGCARGMGYWQDREAGAEQPTETEERTWERISRERERTEEAGSELPQAVAQAQRQRQSEAEAGASSPGVLSASALLLFPELARSQALAWQNQNQQQQQPSRFASQRKLPPPLSLVFRPGNRRHRRVEQRKKEDERLARTIAPGHALRSQKPEPRPQRHTAHIGSPGPVMQPGENFVI